MPRRSDRKKPAVRRPWRSFPLHAARNGLSVDPRKFTSPLPDHLQRKLDVSGLRRQVVHVPVGQGRSGRVKYPSAIDRLWGNKVGAIQDVENLRAELNIKRLRNAVDRNVLGRG